MKTLTTAHTFKKRFSVLILNLSGSFDLIETLEFQCNFCLDQLAWSSNGHVIYLWEVPFHEYQCDSRGVLSFSDRYDHSEVKLQVKGEGNVDPKSRAHSRESTAVPAVCSHTLSQGQGLYFTLPLLRRGPGIQDSRPQLSASYGARR